MSSPETELLGTGGSLCDVARNAIERGLREQRELRPDPEDYPPELREPGASFVTLHYRGDLRGCMGTLEPVRPLVCDVARNAWRSALADPRFAPLTESQLPELELHVAVLSPLEPVPVDSEEQLIGALRPGVDGLVLEEGDRAATFLPAVWDRLPDPRDFLEHLRAKAGLSPGCWSETLRFLRYTTTDAR